MDIFYEARHPDRGCGNIWEKKDYMALAKNLLKYGNYMSMEIRDNRIEIGILNKRLKVKKMPRKMRKYIQSEGLEIMDVIRIKDPTLRQVSEIERKMMKKGKIPLPIGTCNDYCEIRFVDDPLAN